MDANAYKAKGNEAFSAKNYPEAIENFTKAIELDGGNHVLWSNRSAAHASLQHWAAARDDAEKCVSLKADWAKGYIRLGGAQHGLGQFDQAVATYEKGLALEPENDTLKTSLAAVKADKAQAEAANSNPFAKVFGPQTMAKIQASAKLRPFLAQPDYVQIINSLVANPQLVQAFIKDQRVMQTFLELSGIDFSGAEGAPSGPAPAAKPAPKPSPKPSDKPGVSKGQQLKEEGNALYKKRQFDEALEKYNAAIECEPTNTTFYLNRTAVYFEQGRYEDCMQECDRAMEHGKEHKAEYTVIAKLMTRTASCLQKLNRHEEAIRLFKQALLEWRNPETLSKLEACEREKKRMDEEAYISPELSLQKKEEGNALFKADKFPEAVKCYEEAIKRNPKDHTLYSNRAAALLKLGAHDDAIKDCDKCLEIQPTFVKAYARKGHALFWTKQYNKALQAYAEGTRLDPENVECQEGHQRTIMKIQEMAHGEGDEEAAQRAMADPEIQAILQDSYMQLVLSEMQKDPQRLKEYMQDANISAKINKLISCGVLRFGGPGDAGKRGGRGGRGGR